MESEQIFTLDSFKDISLLTLGKPNPLPGGGSYYAKLLYNNKPIDIQAHACLTKQGIVNTGTKSYCDLMYDNKDPIEPSLVNILEQIEEKCTQLIFEKREVWFSTPLEMSDIETAFTSCMRLFKSGKFTLVRTNLPNSKKTIKMNSNTCEVYNQKGENLTLESITSDVKIIPLIRIDELRFTSKSFHINILLNQCLVLDKVDENSKKGCRIKIDSLSNNEQQNVEENKPINLNTNKELILEDKNIEETLKSENIKKKDSINVQTKLDNLILDKNLPNNNNLIVQELEEVDLVPENDSSSEDEEQNEEDSDEEIFEGMKVIRDFKVDKETSTLKLKKPDEVYYELYKRAKEKAKEARKEAIALFLEAKNIKAKYMLDEIDESDDEEFYSDI